MITPTPEFWKIFKETNGALSCTEAVAIMNIAAQAPEGRYIELGTYEGKSAMSAALTLKHGVFLLVDPEFTLDNFSDIIHTVSRVSTNELKVDTVTGFSTEVIPIIDKIPENKYGKKYSYVFVDSGSHQDGLPMQEVKLLEDRMIQGGIIAFHDWDSQFKEVKEASDYLVGTGKYEYIPINWDEIIAYVNENNLEEGNESWHHNELQNPCFVGAVKRK